MDTSINKIRNVLAEKGLKVTPQRIAILDAIYKLEGHPTVDNIIAFIRSNNPNIALGTVYKVLDTFIENKLIKKVTTDSGVMRYDGIMEKHHHIYCDECNVIEDYVDEELDMLLKNYFSKKEIKGFEIKDCVLQIKGVFKKCNI